MTELVQKGTLPTLEQFDDAGKAVVVNQTGNNYTLGAQSGASVVVDSWLNAYIADGPSAPASPLVWSTLTVVGDDLTMPDTHTVLFGTAGLYQITTEVHLELSADVDGALTLAFGGTLADNGLLAYISGRARVALRPGTGTGGQLLDGPIVTLPPVRALAGDTLFINGTAQLAAGSVFLASNFGLAVVRLA